MANTLRYALCPILFVIALALAGCGNDAHKSPPKQQVQDAVAAALSPYISLNSIEVEAIPVGTEGARINFKVVVSPKEDLYQLDREVPGDPKVILIKVVNKAGSEISLYGSFAATRTVDKWTLGIPHFAADNSSSGEPRSGFPAGACVTDSSEAAAAFQKQAANAAAKEVAAKIAAEKQERERIAREERLAAERKAREAQDAIEAKARAEREEKARIAFEAEKAKQVAQLKKEEEERKAAEEAAKQKVLLATLAGASYSGTAKDGDDFVRISLAFSEQNEKELVVKAKIFNPDKVHGWRNLVGELRFEKDAKYSIVLVPADAPGKNGEAKRDKIVGINCNRLQGIYASQWEGNSLKLNIADDGLEGEFGIPCGILGVSHPVSVRLTKSTGTAATKASKPDTGK